MSEQHTSHELNTASALLLNRPTPADYRAEQTTQIASEIQQNNLTDVCSVAIFRLAEEWFALSAKLCAQVLSPLRAHTLPHRNNDTLLGIVNVRGQMLLKVSLRSLLNLQPTNLQPVNLQPVTVTTGSDTAQNTNQAYQRTIVLKRTVAGHTDTWVFDVDEIDGIHTIALDTLESPPIGVETSTATCTQRIFLWQGHRVSWLDDARLFDALRLRAL